MYLSEFKFYSCDEFSNDHPKFLSLFSMEMTTNQSVVDEDGDVVVERKCKEGVGSANKHLVGMKRVKQMKKEDKMVDMLSQKFGIMSNKTTDDEETTQMKMTTNPHLHCKKNLWDSSILLAKECQHGSCSQCLTPPVTTSRRSMPMR